jgi:glycosyltransferase involved in cell wall biosynthesis
MQKNKRIICFAMHALKVGGMEREVAELANHYAEQNNLEVHIVLYGKERSIFYQLNEKITVHHPQFLFNEKYRLLSTLKTFYYLRQKLLQLNPDAVVSFGEYWNSFVLIATRFTALKVYVSDRCQPDKSLGRVHDFLRARLYPHSAGVIAQTERAKAVFKGLYHHSNIQVIGNAIREINGNGESERENIVLSVGRLISTKHFDQLIQLFARLNLPDWKLVIVGGDAIKQQNFKKLNQLIVDLGMTGRIELAGTQKDIDRYYLKSKIFAFMSSSEGFPNVVGEALSAGVPVVAYDCSAGPSDLIIDGKNGFLIPLFDERVFEEALKKMIQDEGLRTTMGMEAKERIKQFSIEVIASKVRNMIFDEKN